ncbi:MAG: hypothetical protein ABI584_03300 [Acidobacteriota bacterium]
MSEPTNGYGELNWEGDEQEKRNAPGAPRKDTPAPAKDSPGKHEDAPGRNPPPSRPEGDDVPTDVERDRGIENPDEERKGG